MGKVTKKCCMDCPALIEHNFEYHCMLHRDIEARDGKLALSIPYSKEPCRKPKSNREYIEMLNDIKEK